MGLAKRVYRDFITGACILMLSIGVLLFLLGIYAALSEGTWVYLAWALLGIFQVYSCLLYLRRYVFGAK